MSRISFWEKLQLLWKVSINTYWLPLVLILFALMGLFFLHTNPRNEKRNKYIYIGFSFTIFLLLLLIYHPSLGQIFDFFMNNLFVAVLFPNFALYFCMIIIMNVIAWISLFKHNASNIIKRVNVIIYILMNYLLALIIQVVNTSKLDIFSDSSLYMNKKATALIELSSGLFVLWILFLILYKIILVYVRKDDKEKVKRVIISKRKLPDNFQPVEVPFYLYGKAGKRVTLIDTKPKEETKEFEKLLTVEDYRLLLKILKEEKEKEKKESNIEKMKQLKQQEKEKIAEMKLQEKIREEEKFTELEMLYRSMK